MKTTTFKKRATTFLALALALVLCVGSFAFFTDRDDAAATATAGNIDLVFEDLSLASEGYAVKDEQGTRSDIAPQSIDKVWEEGTLLVENGVLNPGDVIDMDYKVSNEGSKSIDVHQQIVMTLTDAEAAYIESEPDTNVQEYALVITGGNDSEEIMPTYDAATKTLTYTLADITLAGTVENDGIAIADAAEYAEAAYEVALEFDRLAENDFMDSVVDIQLDIQAKQHRNTTDADWQPWATYETSVEQITA